VTPRPDLRPGFSDHDRYDVGSPSPASHTHSLAIGKPEGTRFPRKLLELSVSGDVLFGERV
jgi:hypothetical protein